MSELSVGMDTIVVTRKTPAVGRRTKVKTGCTTCRVRKIKCDEGKPSCQRCTTTGRACDGYESLFRFSGSGGLAQKQSQNKPDYGVAISLDSVSALETSAQEVRALSRHFSTKTVFDVDLGCDKEAEQVLAASRSDATIRYAVSALQALRQDFEASLADLPSAKATEASARYGIQQYALALRGLATNLSVLGPEGLKSTLLCCQMFVCIEQVQQNYTVMAQHIIQGLRIMWEHRVRPTLVTADRLSPASYDRLPFLDDFVIKLFAAPCKFASLSASPDATPPIPVQSGETLDEPPVVSRQLRALVPNIRGELTRVATSTRTLLDKVSSVKSVHEAGPLLSEKAGLLRSLDDWLDSLERDQRHTGLAEPEPLGITFMRLFQSIMKLILLGTLDSSPALESERQSESQRLLSVAMDVTKRARAFMMIDSPVGE